MLGFAVRGIVLLGVLGWYSAAVWKMIDSYFKDQLHNYLQEEYRKHPRMRADVENARIDDKGPVPSALSAESGLKYSVVESYDSDATCPADVIINACQRAIGSSSGKSEESVASGTGENAADVADVNPSDKNAFPEKAFPGRSGLESRKSSSGSDGDDEERQPSGANPNDDRENEVIEESPASSSRRLDEKRLSEAPKEIAKEISRGKAKKRRANTIIRTDAGARIGNTDDDFSQFEEEDSRRVPEEGILVSELPFKPKADIGGLDRVTAEEFCPLTLEDEASCGETTTWP